MGSRRRILLKDGGGKAFHIAERPRRKIVTRALEGWGDLPRAGHHKCVASTPKRPPRERSATPTGDVGRKRFICVGSGLLECMG